MSTDNQPVPVEVERNGHDDPDDSREGDDVRQRGQVAALITAIFLVWLVILRPNKARPHHDRPARIEELRVREW
jgi:hypothetical protein